MKAFHATGCVVALVLACIDLGLCAGYVLDRRWLSLVLTLPCGVAFLLVSRWHLRRAEAVVSGEGINPQRGDGNTGGVGSGEAGPAREPGGDRQ